MRLAVFLIFLAQLHPAAAAENTWQVTTTGEEFAPLTDDLSRADLFKLFIASGERENPAPGFARRSLLEEIIQVSRRRLQGRRQTEGQLDLGIDISHYTGRNFSFDSLRAQNVRFVYAKATQGVRYKDDLFGLYWQALNDLPAEKKVLRGAYHFLSSSADGASSGRHLPQLP